MAIKNSEDKGKRFLNGTTRISLEEEGSTTKYCKSGTGEKTHNSFILHIRM